jgi:hypothetical protein
MRKEQKGDELDRLDIKLNLNNNTVHQVATMANGRSKV